MPVSTQTSDFADQLSALDQLVVETKAYRSGNEYGELLDFIRRLPSQAPYNCFLLHMQNPHVRYVANARQWRERFRRQIVKGARPLVVLVPFGPVDFVYDIADTDGAPVPVAITDPFQTQGSVSIALWNATLDNCPHDLIAVVELAMGAGSASTCSGRPRATWSRSGSRSG
jgi:hypothetical protein